jgi:hypothetical protein
MGLTKIVSKLFLPRQRELEKHYSQPEALQQDVLRYLIGKGQHTEYGRNHLFGSTNSYTDFASNVPLNSYEELKGDIDRMRHGEPNVLWPGQVKWYAKSSGTTNDKSKFIPVSGDGLQNIHYRGGQDVVTLYLRAIPAVASSTASRSSWAAATSRTITWRARSWATSVPYSSRTSTSWPTCGGCLEAHRAAL